MSTATADYTSENQQGNTAGDDAMFPQHGAYGASTNERGLASVPYHPASVSTRGDKPEDGKMAAGLVSDPYQKQDNKGKGGQMSERDSMIALLSLGRDLQGNEEDEGRNTTGIHELAAASTTHAAPKRPPPQPILPVARAAKPSKKRQKQAKVAPQSTTVSNQNNSQARYKHLPDFWYWLHPGESAGEWDVLCGRGGESNTFVGNRKYRKMINERKPAYRDIPLKQRKAKTAYVRSIVQHVNNCGGRFLDIDEATGNHYVVTMEKARRKTSQALRETKELKWLDMNDSMERTPPTPKNSVCPYCNKQGHKTKIAKACLKHHEWLNSNYYTAAISAEIGNSTIPPTIGANVGSVILHRGSNEPFRLQEIPRYDHGATQTMTAPTHAENGRYVADSSIPLATTHVSQAVNPASIDGAPTGREDLLPMEGGP